MSPVRTFHDLIVWQRGMELAKAIYAATEAMPRGEQFALTIQMRRAAISVPSNIAEGHGRGTTAEFLRCLRIARGSLFELMTQYELAVNLQMIAQSEIVIDLLDEEDRILQGLIKSLERRLKSSTETNEPSSHV